MANQPQAFSKEWVAPEKPRNGLKISNKKSAVGGVAHAKAEFEQAAQQYMDKKQELIKQTLEIGKQFFALLNDKTLNLNKSPINKDIEKETISKIVALALVINQDEAQPEGYGSVAIINLLLKSNFLLRDRVNELDFELAKLKKQMSSLAAPSSLK